MPYCTQQDIEDIIGKEAVQLFTDDTTLGAVAVKARVANAIDRATQRINQNINLIYDINNLSGNAWLKWCCAYLAIDQLMRRGGGTVSDDIRETVAELLEFLKEIKKGISEIPQADRMHVPGISMSNIFVDMRFSRAKVRVRPSISAGEQKSELPRRVDLSDIGLNI